MNRNWTRFAVAITLATLFIGALPAEAAKYRYGKYRRGGGGNFEQGFYVLLEGALTNPRNTDAVLVTVEGGGAFNPIIPRWSDDLAARVGVGYRFAGGSRLQATAWSFSTDTAAASTGADLGGTLHFAIGPPVPTVGDVGSPGTFAVTTEIQATTADLAWGKQHELTDAFSMDWSIGLRYAKFEETYSGVYGQLGGSSYDARKSNEGEGVGARVAVRASHRLGQRFSVNGGLGFSMLDGEQTASSSLTLSGQTNPASSSFLADDSRSGRMLDFDVAVVWHLLSDRAELSLGWEQSTWEDLAADLMRHYPGASVPLRDRDRVVFSGYKLGVLFRF